MLIDIKIIGLFTSLFSVLFGTAELLYHVFKVKVEYTRKLVHVATGIITLSFPFFLQSPRELLILCIGFAGLLGLSLQYNLLQSVNAVQRKTRGSLLYPMAVILCYFSFWSSGEYLFFFLPILILAISDPLAALVGKRWAIGKYSILGNKKTLAGSITFFFSAFCLCLVSFHLLNGNPFNGYFLCMSITIAFTTTITEAISTKGYDNFNIPAMTILILNLF